MAPVFSWVQVDLSTHAGCAASWQACTPSWLMQGRQQRSRTTEGTTPPPAHRRQRSCGSSWTRPGVHVCPCLVVCHPCSSTHMTPITGGCQRSRRHWRAMSFAPAPDASLLELRSCINSSWNSSGLLIFCFADNVLMCMWRRAGASRRRCRRTWTGRCSRPWPRASPPAPAPGARDRLDVDKP